MKETWIRSSLRRTPGSVYGFVLDKNGTVYFTSGRLYRQQQHENAPTIVSLVDFVFTGMVWDGDNTLYLCDSLNHQIVRYRMKEEKFDVIASPTKLRFAIETNMSHPSKIFLLNDVLYVVDDFRIFKIDTKTLHQEVVAGKQSIGYLEGEVSRALFRFPCGIALSKDGSSIFVCDSGNRSIRKIKDGIVSTVVCAPGINKTGAFVLDSFPFQVRCAILLDKDDSLILTDGQSLKRIDLKNNTMTVLSNEVKDSECLTWDHLGNLYAGTALGIVKLENTWKWERFLWIARLKEDVTTCQMASVPKDIVKEISAYLRVPVSL